MSTSERTPVVVGIDDSPESAMALSWAVDEVIARQSPLRVVCAFPWAAVSPMMASGAAYPPYNYPVADPEHTRQRAEGVVAAAVRQANQMTMSRALSLGIDVTGEAVNGNPVETLNAESRHASLVVLGSRRLHALGSAVLGSVGSGVCAGAACPVVVVRGAPGNDEEHAAVVVGVDASSPAEDILTFAFEHADRHSLQVRPVLAWRPDTLATMQWRPQPPAPVQADLWLAEVLAGWQEKYPDVIVHPSVVCDHPVAGLVAASTAAALLVVGSRTQHPVVGTLLGSVSQGVLHHATCPVAVVSHQH